MTGKIIAVVVIGFGTAVYLFIYHRKPRDAPPKPNDRQRIPPVKFYGVVDRALKVAAPTLVVLCILFDHPLLLEFHNTRILRIVGLLVAASGFGLFLWSMRHLGDQFSPCDDPYMPERIVTSGPYRFVRHPVYSSNLLLMIGLMLVSGSWWFGLMLAVMLTFYTLAMLREENALKAKFSNYHEYCGTTGRLCPKLFPRRKATKQP